MLWTSRTIVRHVLHAVDRLISEKGMVESRRTGVFDAFPLLIRLIQQNTFTQDMPNPQKKYDSKGKLQHDALCYFALLQLAISDDIKTNFEADMSHLYIYSLLYTSIV